MSKAILYICISQNTKVLCDYKQGRQSFEEFTSEILPAMKKGRVMLPYQQVEYMCVNEDANGVMYLLLVNKGYSKGRAFACLDYIKEEFERTFDDQEIKRAKAFGLNSEF